ncbi:hypothetical protein B0H21DRAFT_794932 [Amylocystis lapponica]|nr:hypothetical protein B0H21DRAFT_794932 [Amylocystis lapponica]
MSSRAGPSNPAPVRPNRTLMDQEANLVAQIARLSTEDVEALHSRRHGQITDGELAFRLAAEEAQALSAFERDRALAMRLSMHEDKEITTGLETFGKGHVAMRLPTNTVSREDVAKAPAPVQRLTGHNCAICMDPIRGVEIRAPCGDFYDKACILELFQAATRDEALFPPRCCRQNIPLESVRPYMGAALVRLFEEKKVEFGTLKRVYCANQACSRFLGAQIESSFKWWFRRMYTCSCGTGTCTWCKEKFDTTDHHCNTEADRQDQVVLALGEQSGWARCPGCGQLIELNLGCFHMTCRCRTEFCYVCKALWKTCACPQWDERRLLAAAEARVDAEMGHHAAPRQTWKCGNPRDAVQEWMERLREDHDCDHTKWAFRKGGGRCEMCSHNLPQYLFLPRMRHARMQQMPKESDLKSGY